MTTWEDLTEDEREFLLAWRQADADARADALGIMLNHFMLNHQQHGGDDNIHGGYGNVISIEDARRTRGNSDS